MNKSISLTYELFETGVRTKRSLYASRTGFLANSGFEFKELSMQPGQQVSLQGIDNLFFISTASPLQINVNGGGFITVNSFMAITAALTEVIIYNTSTAVVDCIVCDS